MGLLNVEMGDPGSAETLHAQALAIHEHEFGSAHMAVASNLNDLANARLHQGKIDVVEAMYRRSYEIARDIYGPSHAIVGRPLNNLGRVLTLQGRTAEAIEVLRESIAIQELAGEHHPELAYPLNSLGDAYLARDDTENAKRSYQRAVEIRRVAMRSRSFDPLLANSLVWLGSIALRVGDPDMARQHMEEAAALRNLAPATTDPSLKASALELTRWLVELGRCPPALSLLERVANVHARQVEVNREHSALARRLGESCAARHSAPTP